MFKVKKEFFERLADWEEWMFSESVKAYRQAFFVLIIIVLLTLWLLFSSPCIYFLRFSWDSAIMLDGGWRLVNGQRFHTDFYSPLGFLPFGIISLGMMLGGLCGRALIYGPAVVFPIVSLYGWFLSKRRWPAFISLIAALTVGFLIVGNYALGMDGFRDASYAMQYNRMGWALFCLILIQLFVRPRKKESSPTAFWEGVGTGVLLSFILFTKINFFIAALCAALLRPLLFKTKRQMWCGLGAAFMLVSSAILYFFRIDLSAYGHDLRMLAATNSSIQWVKKFATAAIDNIEGIGLLGVMAAFLSPSLVCKNQHGFKAGWLRILAGASAITCLGLIICGANYQINQIPVFGIGALLVSEDFRRRMITPDIQGAFFEEKRIRSVFASLISLYLLSVILIPDFASVLYAVRWRSLCHHPYISEIARVDSETMRDMLFPPKPGEATDPQVIQDDIVKGVPWTSCSYAFIINDGIKLLKPFITPQSRIFVMDYNNPFSFAFKLPSPRGDALFWKFNQVVDDQNHPSPEDVFRDVTLVLARTSSTETAEFMGRVYGTTLQNQFEKIAESKVWILYGRRF